MTDLDLEKWGVASGYWDVRGEWQEARQWVLEAVLTSMEAEGEPPPPVAVTVRLDHELPPMPRGKLYLEDGADIDIDGRLPPDLPAGYHRVEPVDADSFPLIVSPGKAPLPRDRTWGYSTQLYAARSKASWGIGDLSDLERLGSWSARLGAGLALVNPLHAAVPGVHQEPSPYYPSSRCFTNPLYLSIEQVEGSREAPGFQRARAAGVALNDQRLIDRDRIWELKSEVLEEIFRRGVDESRLASYRAARGECLELFATHCALQESQSGGWHRWPKALRDPRSSAVDAFRRDRESADRIRYHCWLQYLLDTQAERAGNAIGVVKDMAVGVDPQGADAWIWQQELSPGMTVGAPPDEFATLGQSWGFPPFDPWRLRSSGYVPWIEALRAGFRFSAGLRVDHVMGLFRLYWIPDDDPREGAYVHYPHHDMLNILSLEAHRAGAYVVGEDLGTVEDWVRDDLGERQVLSYRVWWFEDREPPAWPGMSLAAVTTHDLPTVAGVLSGSDLVAQHTAGMGANEEASQALHDKLVSRARWAPGRPVGEAIRAVYEDLARSPSMLLAATLDDVLAVEERPNMPGTVDEWPNWKIALPVPLESLEKSPLAVRIASALSGRTDGPGTLTPVDPPDT